MLAPEENTPDPDENEPDPDAILKGLGGRDNIRGVSTNNHDLLVTVQNLSLVDEGALKAAGATKVTRHGNSGSFAITLGPNADVVAWFIR